MDKWAWGVPTRFTSNNPTPFVNPIHFAFTFLNTNECVQTKKPPTFASGFSFRVSSLTFCT